MTLLHNLKEGAQKIQALPLIDTLFLILLSFLPFQQRFYKPLNRFSTIAFKDFTLSNPYFRPQLDFYLTDFLMIAILVLAMIKLKKKFSDLFFKRPIVYLGLFLVSMLTSIIFSDYGHLIWPYWHFIQLALPMAAFLSISLSLHKEKWPTICFWILLFTSGIESIIVTKQYFIQHPIGLKSLGELRISLESAAQFQMGNKTRWVVDSLFGWMQHTSALRRGYGTFPHPNICAAFLSLSLFASFPLFLQSNKRGKKIVIGGVIMAQIWAIFLTFSRAAILGAVGGSSLFFLCFIWEKGLRRQGKKLALVIGSATALSFVLLYPQLTARGGVVNYNGVARHSDEPRWEAQQRALEIASDHPFLGCGMNLLPKMIDGNRLRSAPLVDIHNIYIKILAEGGPLALATFLGSIATLIYRTLTGRVDLTRWTLMGMLGFLLASGWVDCFLINSQQGKMMLFLILSLLFSVLERKKGETTLHSLG